MKKTHILSAVLLMAALVSCQENEISNVEYIPKEGEIVFNIRGNGRTTKSMDPAAPVKGMTIDLGSQDGTHFFLEETVINLNDLDFGPQTKGTPAYTENLGQLYENNLGVYADKGTFGDFAYESAEKEIGTDGKWLYKHHYDSEPWPDDNETPVGFYLRMPATPAGLSFGENPYSDGKITFTYASPNNAAATEDILFGYRSLAKKDYPKTGIPAVLFHALTGVKFAIGNEDDGIVITEVIFEGLYDGGTCVISPANIEIAGTESYDVTEWPSLTSRTNFTISTGSLLTDDGEQQIADYSKSKYDFPESFTGAGVTNNLNDDNASKTFWLIPQGFEGRDEVMLTIKYNYGDKTGLETKLALGEILGERGIVWNAGELRTYTIKIDDVNLQIEDEVVPETVDGKETIVKKDVKITNTSNVDVFIRAAIVGQWVTKAGDPIFGFTDKVNKLYVVESWYEDQFVNKGRSHGKFVDLAGYDKGNLHNKWQYSDPADGGDGFYYYTESVAPDAQTNALFTKYVLGTKPNAELAGQELGYEDMYFVLEISTQAISAVTSKGTLIPNANYAEAWAAASRGEKPTE